MNAPCAPPSLPGPPRKPKKVRKRRPQSGFTMAELLLASALGALLLTSLAVTTYTAMANVSFMEEKAGLKTSADSVLRQITRDVREAWWADVPGSTRLRLSYPDGRVTEYSLHEGALRVTRPDGTKGDLLSPVEALSFEATMSPRHREGAPLTQAGPWYQVAAPASAPVALDVPVGGQLTLAFALPVTAEELPIPPSGSEQLLGSYAGTLVAPLAWAAGSLPANLVLTLYESRGPGSGVPYGSALASVSVAGSALPVAQWNGAGFDPPATAATIDLSALGTYFEPGTGHVLVLEAQGDAQLVVAAHGVTPGTARDDVCLRGPGVNDSYLVQPVVVPTTLSGSYWTTDTITSNSVSRVTITLQLPGEPAVVRSAALLSQAISDDPWLGVVPGETPP